MTFAATEKGEKPMPDKLKTAIQEAFAEQYTLDDVARLYFDIRMECEKQLEYMSMQIAKEMHDNGVFNEVSDNG